MKKHQTTFHLEERDREAIAQIREYYGLTSDIAAIRIALRELQRHIQTGSSSILSQKERGFSPHA